MIHSPKLKQLEVRKGVYARSNFENPSSEIFITLVAAGVNSLPDLELLLLELWPLD